ncbi:MAG: hypothetical protein ACOYB2_02470 [Limnohabitans sp.]
MTGAYPVQDFADGRVLVVPAGDSRYPLLCADDHFGVHQAADGPIYILVGCAVPDERLVQSLPKLARFGVTLEQLQRARDQARV